MASVVVLPRNTYSGSRNFGPVNVPNGLTYVELSLDRSLWTDSATAVDFGLELSQDNGQTWAPWGRATAVGGVILAKDGVTVLAKSSFYVSLPNPDNTQRKLRGDVTITGSVNTVVTVTTG